MNKNKVDLQAPRILLVDDQPANLNLLYELLEGEGYRISVAPSGPVALKVVEQAEPDLILLDVMMPGMDGFEVCRRLKQDEKTQDIPVVFITALTEDVVQGFQAGGVDYITKPFRDEEVLVRVRTHLRINRLQREVDARNAELLEKNQALEEEIAQRKTLKGQLSVISEREAERWGLEALVGQSPTIQRIFKQIRLMQENAATSVLITGESGTGKELIARAIHYGGARAAGPFEPVNCAAVPSELIESLFFGHVRGAFTGADSDRMGHFQMAHEGTLFLDEIGDMPLELQATLLRVLEDGEVRRIGEAKGTRVDVRVVAATNADLQERIQSGKFRQDLYYRLAQFTVPAPPLRQRKEDIPLLARHFVQLCAREMGMEAPVLSPQVLEVLAAYEFPGNVRELKNTIGKALIESGGGEIRSYHLDCYPEVAPGESVVSSAPSADVAANVPLNLDQAELWVIKRALGQTGGNISEAARLLGTNRNRIYRVLAEEKERTGR